jgi:hypothetical protein
MVAKGFFFRIAGRTEMNTENAEKNEMLYKIVTFLDREELDFLDALVKDLFFKKGKKTPRSEVLREIVKMAMHLNSFGKTLVDDLSQKNTDVRPAGGGATGMTANTRRAL